MTNTQSEFQKKAPGEITVVDKRHTAVDAPVQRSSSQALVEMAMRTGDLDKLQKAMELQERWEANEARKAYMQAMSEFKSEPLRIDKDKSVSFGQGKTSYSHASLANVTGKINSGLSKVGLSAAWKTNQDNGTITVTCTITHRDGHSESTSLTASPDTSGSKNSIQAIGSTITYLERYTLLALTGLATYDADDDGHGAEPPELVTTDQATLLNDLIKETNSNLKVFLKVAKAESVDQVLARDYPLLLNQLKTKQAKLREPGMEG